MDKKLKTAKNSFSANDKRILSDEELAFITGESAILSGAGTSSTSGSVCCDATCVCKNYPPIFPGSKK